MRRSESGFVKGKQGSICEANLSHMGRTVLCSKLLPEPTKVGRFLNHGTYPGSQLQYISTMSLFSFIKFSFLKRKYKEALTSMSVFSGPLASVRVLYCFSYIWWGDIG